MASLPGTHEFGDIRVDTSSVLVYRSGASVPLEDPNFPEFPFVYPDTGIAPGDPLLESLGPSSVAFLDTDFRNPRTSRGNLGIERALSGELSVGADFVIAKTVGSRRRTNRNLSPPFDFDAYGRGLYNTQDRVDPSYGEFQVDESTARRRYTALILSAKKRFARTFQFEAYYMFSQNKTDDDNELTSSGYGNSQPENLGADWADSSLDVRHRLVANGVFELPGGFMLGALIAMNTGRPFNVVTGFDDNGDGNFTDRAVVDSVVSWHSQYFGHLVGTKTPSTAASATRSHVVSDRYP